MSSIQKPTRIFLAPAPRAVNDIFDANDLARLRALGELIIHEDGPVTDAVFAEKALGATIIMGQFDLPSGRLSQLPDLKAIFNVEGNFLPNVDYAYCFKHNVRVLNVSPVFAEPVAEAALGMAIDLARGISRSDRRFRNNAELYGLDANRDAYTLFRQKIGFIGMGDLGKAMVPLLKPFNCDIIAYDPWLPADYLASLGCVPATLEQVLQESRIVFVVAGVTAQNQGFLDAAQFASMQAGASLI
ncbi:MAG: NAD(P)-dependent oxidoreductase, partial [Collimonas pratensis]|uniref:NAD(P)-dependent oxidoreductase n=1 Tax=Collimonas pratensis TaxID=279113 RepID=UPI003C75AD78